MQGTLCKSRTLRCNSQFGQITAKLSSRLSRCSQRGERWARGSKGRTREGHLKGQRTEHCWRGRGWVWRGGGGVTYVRVSGCCQDTRAFTSISPQPGPSGPRRGSLAQSILYYTVLYCTVPYPYIVLHRPTPAQYNVTPINLLGLCWDQFTEVISIVHRQNIPCELEK